MRSSGLSVWELRNSRIENVERLCKYLKIPEGYTAEHKYLIAWLDWQGVVESSRIFY